jgi:hypothetical protein
MPELQDRLLVYTNIDLVVLAWSVKSEEVRLLVYTNIDLVVLAWSVKSEEVIDSVYNLFTFY